MNAEQVKPGLERPEFETPSWLTKKFVGTTLREIVSDTSIVVKDVEFTNVGGKRGRFGSDFNRVTISYKNAASDDNKSFLIVKSLSTNVEARKFLVDWKYFEREIHMYEVILPAMYSLIPTLVSRHLPAEDPLPLSPRYFPTTRPHTVIMEDLSKQGYQLCTKKVGLDHGHAKLALIGMAKFHALSLALFKKVPGTMAIYEERFYVDSNREQIKKLIEQPFVDLPNEVATWPGYEKYADKLRAIPIVDRVIEAMSIKPGTVSVLNHGDFWTSNIMFQYDKKGEAIAVKFVDFQQSRFVSPALDIIFFMFSTPSEVVRDSFWDTFLEVYHKTFCSTLKLAGADPNLLSVEHLTEAIQDKMFFGLLVASIMLPHTYAALEKTPLEGTAVYGGPRFKKAFQKLLPFFEKKNIL